MSPELIFRSIMLGVGLAMDAFSVSIADGLSEPNMKSSKMLGIAGTFAGFQFAMPVIGWILVRTAVETFGWLEKFIPWIALVLLLYIGGKMLREGISESRAAKQESGSSSETSDLASADTADADCSSVKSEIASEDSERAANGPGEIIIQGIATSIDALSVGFTIERYTAPVAFASSIIIGVVTFGICMAGLASGKKAGTILSGKASILGGAILIFIGLEIWAKGLFF